MDLSASSREDPFSPETFFSKQDLPAVPNDNPETYCRLCLTTPEVEPLFPINGEPNVYVMELIGKYIGIGLTIQDDYPCAVCRSCHLILDQFDLFRQNCLKVDIAIRRRRLGLDVPPVEVKSEPADEEDNEEEMPYIRVERNHYQCRFCTETFRSLAMFLTHCKEDHPEESRMFKCKQCNKAFMTKTARLQHIRSHQPNNGENDQTGDRVQVCEKCMVTFDSYKLLKIHLKEHHSNDPKQDTLVCGTCSKQFSRITILRNHILRVHMGKLPHVCKQCGVSFGYTQQLISHLKDQHGIIVDQLNQSGQSSNAEDDLEQMDELPYIPVVPQISTPEHHEGQQLPASLPSVETPPQSRNHYTCSECSAQCASTEDLRNHRKLHQDPTWWKCTHCRNFVKHQKMHLMKKHPTIDPEQGESSFLLRYRCWLCRVYFKSLQQMEQHVATRHGVILPPSLSSSLAAAAASGEGSSQFDDEDDDEDGGGGEESSTAGAMMPPPAPQAGIPLPLTVQPPGLPFLPEHLPLLLSQMENGAWDYLREMSRLMDPANLAAFAAAMKIKVERPEPMETGGDHPANEYDDGVVDLSTNSSTSMNTTLASDDEQDSSEEEHNYIRLDNRLYQCRFCSETFRHLLLIRKHTKAAHPTEWKSFKCPHCKRRFPSAAIRDRHAHFHTLQHQFVCASCDQMYDSKKRLEQHVTAVHDPASANFTAERLRCGACRLSFTEKKYFDMHLKIYHQRKPQRLKNLTDRLQVCERCVITFESREALQEHVRQVHKEDQPLRSCECPKCGKDLKTTTLLRTHILVVHLGHLPFVCQHCEAAFSTRHWLLKHIEKDHAEAAAASTALEGTDFIVISQPPTQPPPPTTMIEFKPPVAATAVSEEPAPSIIQRPLKCTGCEEYFDDSEKLSVHVTLVHAAVPPKIFVDPESGQPRLACGKCDKQYTSRDELEKHVLKAHPTFMLLYKCPLCVKPIRYRKQHMRVHHDTEYDPKEHHYLTRYKCHCCSKLFKSKRNLTSHQNTLLFQCDKCHMRFKTKKSFQSHAAIHRANKSMLKCADCGLEFGYRARLEEHRSRYHSPHSTEVLKLLNCPYCPRLFISASNRERHVTINHPQSGFMVSCGHCEGMRSADSSEIRRHYREVHPAERVTFRCAECVNKIYLNFSSYKDHYKAKHAASGTLANGQGEQSFSGGESSSAAEVSFAEGGDDAQIKQEPADIVVEDTKLMEESVTVKEEPAIKQEEGGEVPEQEVSEKEVIVKGESKETSGEAIATDAQISSEKPLDEEVKPSEEEVKPSEEEVKPLEEAKPLEPESEEKISESHSSVEVTNETENVCDKGVESKDLEQDKSIAGDEKESKPVVDIDAKPTESSQTELEDKPEQNISTPEETVPSTKGEAQELEANEPETLVQTDMKETLPESPTNNTEEPAPDKTEHEPEVAPAIVNDVDLVAPPSEPNLEPVSEAKQGPELDTAVPSNEATAENSPPEVEAAKLEEPAPVEASKSEEPLQVEASKSEASLQVEATKLEELPQVEATKLAEPPQVDATDLEEPPQAEAVKLEEPAAVNDPKPEAIEAETPEPAPVASEAKEEEPDEAQQPPVEEVVDQKSDEKDEDGGGGGGIAKSAKRARKDSGSGSGNVAADAVDSNQNNDSLVALVEQKPTHDLSEATDENQPPAKRGRKKKKRRITPARKPQTLSDHRKQNNKAAVIVPPIIQMPDGESKAVSKLEVDSTHKQIKREPESVLDMEPKIELIDCYLSPELELNPEIGPTKSDSIQTFEIVDEPESSATKPAKAVVCTVSLTRLDDDVFPPIRNHEIPLNKCVPDSGLAQRTQNDAGVQGIPRKKPKLMAKRNTLGNDQRRLIPRFLTCKRCGLGGIARTSFSAHRNKCLRLQVR
uniref:Putative homeobox transcription factor sip1 n=1 Tax=Culex tarsalis TaxID=7177 RepID=A0A1Q3G0N0_CULTA